MAMRNFHIKALVIVLAGMSFAAVQFGQDARASISDRGAIMETDQGFAAASEGLVYITPEGCCYHRRSCRTIADSEDVSAITREDAQRLGRRACKVCKT